MHVFYFIFVLIVDATDHAQLVAYVHAWHDVHPDVDVSALQESLRLDSSVHTSLAVQFEPLFTDPVDGFDLAKLTAIVVAITATLTRRAFGGS